MFQKLFVEQEEHSGFLIKGITFLEDVHSIAYEMVHRQSGAKLIYLQNDDQENLFSIAFKTPPCDNTGIPHILEHSVLCGSKRYPVKDPFVELLKTSLATFLNAMTYPDKTVYPCASMNEEDFYNIVRVYCDAVFFPLLSESHFKQEGHHFVVTGSPENRNCTLSIRGIVYNEMKGLYSDLDGIIGREESKSIFPDNCYGKDAGGDPMEIPNLTYKKFREFHSKYYHPSNAYLIVYGSFNIRKTLAILDQEYLSNFKKKSINPLIKRQKLWTSPVYKAIKYPLDPGEDKKKRFAVTINFLTNDLNDTLTSLAMVVLELYLLDNSSSPLRKALIDSKYGEALTSSGYSNFQRDTFFSVGLKNTDKRNVSKIIDLILSVCKKEATQGLIQYKLDSVFNKLTLEALEIQSSYPLVIMDRIYDYWIYDSDPLCMMHLNGYIEKLKELRNIKPKFFEDLLFKYIVNNKHYSVLTFIPDPEYHVKLDKNQEAKLKKIKAALAYSEILKIKKDAEYLKAFQSQPNSKEALETLPRLALSKIEKNISTFRREFIHEQNRTLIFNNVFSNDINYLNLAIDLKSMPEDLIDFIPLFKTIFLKMGTTKYDYAEMAEREAFFTGGISSSLLTEGSFNDHTISCPYLVISSKSIGHNLENMLQIICERLQESIFTDIKRLKDVLLQTRTALKGNIVSAGSSYATSFAAQKLGKNLWLSEKFSGITYLRFLNKLVNSFTQNHELIVEKLNLIRDHLLKNSTLVLSFIGNDCQRKIINHWSKNIASRDTHTCGSNIGYFRKNKLRSGIIVPAAVAYNAAVCEAVSSSNEYAPALSLIGNFLTYNYLWEEVRVKRGAYGASANYSSLNGIFSFSTYRDPCIQESFETFNESLDMLQKAFSSKKELEQSIIGTLKKLDKPIRPDDAVGLSLIRYIRNITDDHRLKFRTLLMSLTPKKVKNATDAILKPGMKALSICSLSGEKQLENANSSMKKPLRIERLF